MAFNFNNAEPQSNGFDLIPANTICRVVMNVRPGGAGDDGWLKQSKNSDSLYFDCEFTVVEGQYTRRKLWQNIGWSGGKVNEKGESIFGNMGRSMLRAIVESAKGIRPDDQSPAAVQGRTISGIEEFNQFAFLVKIGIEKGVNGYADKNKIVAVITPDMKEYQQAGPGQQFAPAPAPSAPASQTPAWGRAPEPMQPPSAKQSVPQGMPIPAWAR